MGPAEQEDLVVADSAEEGWEAAGSEAADGEAQSLGREQALGKALLAVEVVEVASLQEPSSVSTRRLLGCLLVRAAGQQVQGRIQGVRLCNAPATGCTGGLVRSTAACAAISCSLAHATPVWPHLAALSSLSAAGLRSTVAPLVAA